MGTPDFAVATLKKLVDHGHTICGVITAPDKPAGRGQRLRESAVKLYAEQQGLKVLQPTNLKDNGFLSELRELKADLFVVVAFRMLPQQVWQMPKYGTFNLHASLLPDYRGAAPINWAIMNGETETGVTTFLIDEKIDTGAILLQRRMPIDQDETAGSLHDKLMEIGGDLVLETIALIASGEARPQKQRPSGEPMPAHKIHKNTCQIDWQKGLQAVYDHIRGLSPYPTAWTTLVQGEESLFLKIYKAAMEPKSHRHPVGKVVVEKNLLSIAVAEGFVRLLEIQLPGKRRMKTADVLNGLRLSDKAHVV